MKTGAVAGLFGIVCGLLVTIVALGKRSPARLEPRHKRQGNLIVLGAR